MKYEELDSKWQKIAMESAIDAIDEVCYGCGLYEDGEITEDSEEVKQYIEEHIYEVVYDPYTRDYELIIRSRY